MYLFMQQFHLHFHYIVSERTVFQLNDTYIVFCLPWPTTDVNLSVQCHEKHMTCTCLQWNQSSCELHTQIPQSNLRSDLPHPHIPPTHPHAVTSLPSVAVFEIAIHYIVPNIWPMSGAALLIAVRSQSYFRPMCGHILMRWFCQGCTSRQINCINPDVSFFPLSYINKRRAQWKTVAFVGKKLTNGHSLSLCVVIGQLFSCATCTPFFCVCVYVYLCTTCDYFYFLHFAKCGVCFCWADLSVYLKIKIHLYHQSLIAW